MKRFESTAIPAAPTAGLLFLLSALALGGCGLGADDGGVDLRRSVRNDLANIPPQCFTKTRDAPGGRVQNPCYACHADAAEPNFQSQPENQLSYAFPLVRSAAEVRNDWSNLFVDRREAMRKIDDETMLRYVRTDNYRDASGEPALAARLADLPRRWDVDGDGRWSGYRPDAGFRFDAAGYDLDRRQQRTGWRVFSYYPFPGTFMPTNGSFDDVLIRLPRAFRETVDGRDDETVYRVNLAIVESLVRRADVPIDEADERALGVDLDRDGKLGAATRVVFDWAPLEKRLMRYVGRAGAEQVADRVHAATGLFPEGTEFLHSVRYLDVGPDGSVQPSARMKELRYARKRRWLSYSALRQDALIEAKEAAISPDRPEQYIGNPEHGLETRLGWVYQGFIEDRDGRLRPQTQEESQFCAGCHGGLSATDDGIFSFGRKVQTGPRRGWTPWRPGAYAKLADPRRADGRPEFATYLLNNEAGDEYRANDEVRARYFSADGRPRTEAFDALRGDLSTLLLPSRDRALALDKAYWLIVREQSFDKGRDAVLRPAEHVWRSVPQDAPTGVETAQTAPRLAASAAIERCAGTVDDRPASSVTAPGRRAARACCSGWCAAAAPGRSIADRCPCSSSSRRG